MKNLFTIIIGLLALSFVGSLSAQLPQAFYFESLVINTDGTPLINQNIGASISILAGGPTGTVVYSETQEINTNALGGIQIAVGTGNVVEGDVEDIDWENNTHFIQLSTDLNGGSDYSLVSVQQLLAVPYALIAENLRGPQGEQGPPGPPSAQGPSGATGPQGVNGITGMAGIATDGIKCWDLNGDGLWDNAEDTNQDGIIDLDDCKGEPADNSMVGPEGLQGPSGNLWQGNNISGESSSSPEIIYHNWGNIGIGTNDPACQLDVTGNICANGVTLNSDQRYKKNILPIENSLVAIQKIRGVKYHFDLASFPTKNFSEREQIGLIAQEVEAVFPELVTTNSEGYKAVNYVQLTPVLLEAIKELTLQKEALQTYKNQRIDDLEKKLEDMMQKNHSSKETTNISEQIKTD